MRLTCPACGAEMSLDALLVHEGARRVVAQAMQISAPLAARLMRYLALFRPAKRQLTMDRVETLLGELVPMIQTCRFTRRGREWSLDADDWKVGLDTVLAHRDEGKLKLPLKSHGYLLEVLAGLADAYEGRQEREMNKRLARGERPAREQQSVSTDGPVRLDAALPKAQLPQHIKDELAKLGVRQPKPAPDQGTEQ